MPDTPPADIGSMRVSGSFCERASVAAACVATTLLALVSLLPGSWKAALHTRGPLHFWAHLYAFGGLCTVYLWLARNKVERYVSVVGAMLLAFGLELAQAHARIGRIEGQDLAWDLLGAGFSVAVQQLKPLLISQNALLAQAGTEQTDPAVSW